MQFYKVPTKVTSMMGALGYFIRPRPEENEHAHPETSALQSLFLISDLFLKTLDSAVGQYPCANLMFRGKLRE